MAMDDNDKKHLGYFLMLFFSWVACCVVFGGELHRITLKRTDVERSSTQTVTTIISGTYAMYYEHYLADQSQSTTTAGTSGSVTRESDTSGAVNYQQCTTFAFCNRCRSGGSGAIAMAVFAFLCITLAAFLRGMVLWGKHTAIPRLGANESTYAMVERATNWTAAGFYVLSIVAWCGGCIAATATERGMDTLIPTGLCYVVLCLGTIGAAIWQIGKVHEATGFGVGGNISKPTPAPSAV